MDNYLNRVEAASTGELLEIERLTSSSERGRRKSTRQGNSSAAYSTACTVRRGESGDGSYRARLLPYSSSGCVPSPPGKTLIPGFLPHGVSASHLVIFRQDTPDNESGQGTNGGPKRGADPTDNHGIAYRQ